MNLLPEELRQAEAREQKRPVEPPARAGYSAPVSEFEERLRGLAAPRRSLWQRLTDWLSSVPVEQGVPLAPPIDVRPAHPPRASQPGAAPEFMPRPSPPAVPPAKVVGPPPVVSPTASTVVARQPSPRPAAARGTPPPIPLGVLLDVNLLPSDARLTAGGQRPSVRLALIAGSLVLIIGIIYAVLLSLVTSGTSKLAAAQATANDLEAQATALTTQLVEVQSIGHKMGTLQSLLTARPDWGKFFGQLEHLTLPTVSYASAAVAGTQVSLAASAPSIRELARQLLVFQQATGTVATVVMGSLSTSEGRANQPAMVQTTFQLDLVPAWLATTPVTSSAQP